MNLRIILLVGVMPLFCSGQTDSINQFDSNGCKQAHWIYYGKNRPELKYAPEAKVEEGKYVNARKEGLWYRYYEDGTIKLAGEYQNNRPNGFYSKYYAFGQLKESGKIIHNKYSGTICRYYPSGLLASEHFYNEETMNCDSTINYFESGCYERIQIFDSNGYQQKVTAYKKDSCNVVDKDYESRFGTKCNFGSDCKMIYKKKSKANDTIAWGVQRPKAPVTSRNFKEYLSSHSDENLCTENEPVKKYNAMKNILFDGTCVDGKVWDGKLFFYDDDEILIWVEVWREGSYLKDSRF